MEMDIPSDDINEVSEVKKLDAALKLLKAAENNLASLFSGLENVIRTTREDVLTLQIEQTRLENQKRELQRKSQQQELEITGLTQDQQRILAEYEHVKQELEKLTKIASGDENVSFSDMRATLVIYATLFKEVYSREPHFKVLYLLHGDAEEMDVDALKLASGIGGAMILRACHELSNANLISFDIDSKKAKLVNRLFPKRKK